MGVLRDVAGQSIVLANTAKTKSTDFAVDQLMIVKGRVVAVAEWLPKFPCDAAKTAVDNILAIIDQIMQLKLVVWSHGKLYTLYSAVITNIETLLVTVGGFVERPAQVAVNLLRESFEMLVSFVATTFDKLDDKLVTPVVKGTCNGLVRTYTVTTDFAFAKYTWVKDTFVMPVTSAVTGYVVFPMYKRVSSAALCATNTAIQTGAYVDKKLSLVGLMMTLLEKTQKVDDCMTKGRIQSKVVFPAIENARKVDSWVTGGKAEDFLQSCKTEFQVAKGEAPSSVSRVAPGLVTSVGPPATRV